LPEQTEVSRFRFGYSLNRSGPTFNEIKKRERKPVGKLYSWLPKNRGLALDLGSAKDKKNRSYIESVGLNYVSVDFDSPEAMVLADAHSLPFRNNTFSTITNLAVMEHIEYPHVAGREMFRILKKGGRMLGVVAFLQQQHMSSWFHFTHFGVFSWLTHSGFKPQKIKIDAAANRYHGIFTTCSLIGLPLWMRNALVMPIYILHRILWNIYQLKSGVPSEKRRQLQTAAAIHFVAEKILKPKAKSSIHAQNKSKLK